MLGDAGRAQVLVPGNEGIDDLVARLFDEALSASPTRRQAPLQFEAYDNLEPFALTAETLAPLERNSRAYIIGDNDRLSLSEALQRADVGDHLVHSDGWVFDYRELTEYAEHVVDRTLAGGVITNPMTRAPIDLRSAEARDRGAPLELEAQPPQRVSREALERLLNEAV